MGERQYEFPNLPDRLRGLEEIAENLWWSWNPAARMLFKGLNRRVWKERLWVTLSENLEIFMVISTKKPS